MQDVETGGPESRTGLGRQARSMGAVLVGVLVSACSGSPATSASTGSAPTSLLPSATGAATPAAPPSAAPSTSAPVSPTGSPSPLATLAGCPKPVAFSTLTPLTHATSDVDDLTVAADGHLWVTAVNSGRILEFDATGRLLRTIPDPRGPEGIVPLPGGGLALAEQNANRVVRLDPASGTVTLLLDVPNRTSNLGVDGLAIDPAHSRLIVPDSANGRLLALPLTASGAAAGAPQVLATGLGRPVAAWPEADGSVEVGVENAPGLVRVGAAGGVTPVVARGTLSQVDEVFGEAGLLYVTDLTLHLMAAVDPRSGALAPLVTAAADPQGLALLPDGRFLLIESITRALVVVPPCPSQ